MNSGNKNIVQLDGRFDFLPHHQLEKNNSVTNKKRWKALSTFAHFCFPFLHSLLLPFVSRVTIFPSHSNSITSHTHTQNATNSAKRRFILIVFHFNKLAYGIPLNTSSFVYCVLQRRIKKVEKTEKRSERKNCYASKCDKSNFAE